MDDEVGLLLHHQVLQVSGCVEELHDDDDDGGRPALDLSDLHLHHGDLDVEEEQKTGDSSAVDGQEGADHGS